MTFSYHRFKGEGAEDVDVQPILVPGTGHPAVQTAVEALVQP